MNRPTTLTLPNGQSIAYRNTHGEGMGVMFCSGFRSDMTSTKATAVGAWCEEHAVPFIGFDYRAHGASDGEWAEFTIGQAIEDALAVIDQVATQDIILIGSSMGAWIALHAALERKGKVRGFIGIAGAPDFTEKLMFPQMTPEQRREMEEEGQVWVPSDYGMGEYAITRTFIHEARTHLLLEDIIGLDIPVHLLHGQEDADVPWETSLDLAAKLMSDEVTTTFIKDGDHRLSRPQDIELLTAAVARMLNNLKE